MEDSREGVMASKKLDGLSCRKGTCLVSQQLRQRVEDHRIIGADIAEGQIQVSSFEPRLTNEVFIIDTEVEGVFRPDKEHTIAELLMKLPERQRKRFDITDGFEIKRGATYLFPLQEQLVLSTHERVMSSPKSSFGRLFLNTRLLTDYNPCVDEISAEYKSETPLQLWLLVQPLTFNLIVYPNLTLNQLRFFTGVDAALSDHELLEEFKKSPLLRKQDDRAAQAIVNSGLQIHLDVRGSSLGGLVGLRARHTPVPVDLRALRGHDTEDFFESIYAKNDKITIRKGEHYLLASEEILHIPSHLSAEVKSHSHILIHGPLHFAGFIDNGFSGNLVFEIRSDEITNTVLRHGMPISKLDLFRVDTMPDKVYDGSNNYKGQVGVNPSKFFRSNQKKVTEF